MAAGTRLKVLEAARLRFSKAPASEFAAAALVAAHDADLERCDYLVIAVPRGAGFDVAPRVLAAADAEVERFERSHAAG